jgi:SNF2 family DNA or RNA helicase
MEIIGIFNKELHQLLSKLLPTITEDWWQSLVIDKLTFQQKSFAQNLPINGLDQLDLAALLRVIDQNWYEISSKHNLSKDSRNWLKEAQSIRNRWSHAPANGLPDDVCYRDIDTIERLLEAIGTNESELKIITEYKQNILHKLTSKEVSTNTHSTNVSSNLAKFNPGDLVQLKADSSKKGAVIAVLKGENENRYQVFQDNVINTLYESQIELAATDSKRIVVHIEALNAALSAFQLKHPSINHLYSLFASRINFVPYQFRPIIKLIKSDRPRMLIADEVGVGKTIEAGLILKELQARHEIKSVLIICPKPLVAERKWLDEMKRFDEKFEQLDGKTLRYCIDETHLEGIWPQSKSRVIVPYSLFDENLLMGKQDGRKKQIGLIDLDPPLLLTW